MNFKDIINKQEKISIVGLGYVGLPIAIAFAKKVDVIGFDISEEKINQYKSGLDPTNEVGNEAVRITKVEFTCNEEKLRDAKFHIVAVPTPVNNDHTPDLGPVRSASRTVGRNLTIGSYVVFESTVYPGVTDEICIPILEKESGLKCGIDFKVGYSPERINPGDKIHRLETIVKVVSGIDDESLNLIAKVYELVVEAGVYKADSIKVAEAAKVIENSQRDINIAFMNELSIIFNKLNIDTKAVLEAAGTKWNFLNFTPGLVGGHCIGVDPYYLTYRAEQAGYHSQIILSGRQINDGMGKYIAENVIKNIIRTGISVLDAKIAVLGLTFKENCPDTRNTKIIDVINELKEYGLNSIVSDPQAEAEEVKSEYGISLENFDMINNMDVVIVAVAHEEYKILSNKKIESLFRNDKENSAKVLIDIKGILDKNYYISQGYKYFRL